jgi:hypothetical protein
MKPNTMSGTMLATASNRSRARNDSQPAPRQRPPSFETGYVCDIKA